MTALGTPAVGLEQRQSFPQPDDIEAEDEEQDVPASTEAPAAIDAPRTSHPVAVAERDGTQENAPTKTEVRDIPGASKRIANGAAFGEASASAASASAHGRKGQEPFHMQSVTSQSFVTASEGTPRQTDPLPIEGEDRAGSEDERETTSNGGTRLSGEGSQTQPRSLSVLDSQAGFLSIADGNVAGGDESTSSLLQRDGAGDQKDAEQERPSTARGLLNKVTKSSKNTPLESHDEHIANGNAQSNGHPKKKSGLVHFEVPKRDSMRDEWQMKARMAQSRLRRASGPLRRTKARDGEILKMEKMLVRMDTTRETLPEEYDENESQRVTTKTIEKWREYMVVCREATTEDADFLLQLYKTRVIPELEGANVKKRSTHEIVLSRKTARCNLFSSLDKTFVVWAPNEGHGTRIFVLKAHSAAASVEWFTFLRSLLGWHRALELQVNIPDLDLSLHLDNPFAHLEKPADLDEEADADREAFLQSFADERSVATTIVQKCLDELESTPDLRDVVAQWARNRRMGLAWKRYDRLEWVFGENEKKMYGTIAMFKSHDLELRPKEHYPTSVKMKEGKPFEEPVPVEGFLVRLTSQKGVHQRFGRLFYKRLYFSTYDQYLVFSRPAKAVPPPPPKLPATQNAKIPSSSEIAAQIPIIYAVNPYPTEDGELAWLKTGQSASSKNAQHHDADAEDESHRRVNILLNCDGFINLTQVVHVRNVLRGATPADEEVDEGESVDYDESVEDTQHDDGATTNFDDSRTFELVLKNGLVLRLQVSIIIYYNNIIITNLHRPLMR